MQGCGIIPSLGGSLWHGAEEGTSKAGEELTAQPEANFILSSTQCLCCLVESLAASLCISPTCSLPSVLSLLSLARQTSC